MTLCEDWTSNFENDSGCDDDGKQPVANIGTRSATSQVSPNATSAYGSKHQPMSAILAPPTRPFPFTGIFLALDRCGFDLLLRAVGCINRRGC